MRLDNGKEMSAALDRLRHIDHGYASTSHSAQGRDRRPRHRQHRHPTLAGARQSASSSTSRSVAREIPYQSTPTTDTVLGVQSIEPARNPSHLKRSLCFHRPPHAFDGLAGTSIEASANGHSLRTVRWTARISSIENQGGARSTGTARHRLRRTLRLARRAAFRRARLGIQRAPSSSGEGRAPSKWCSA